MISRKFSSFLFIAALWIGLLPASEIQAAKTTPTPAQASPAASEKPVVEAACVKPVSVVRVNSTNQPYDFLRPWSKKAPYQRRAAGAVLPGNRVLVTADLAANATYIELENAETGEKTPANIEVVDYDCNLALIKPSTSGFLEKFTPLAITEPSVGDELAVWQFEANGTLISSHALFTNAEVARYPLDTSSLLLYHLTTSLQPRETGFNTPVIKNGGLAGMLYYYDSRSQNADVIPAPVIQHFLQAAASKTGYTRFPKVGIAYSPLRDPQLRRYAGAANGNGGVYLTSILRGSAAEKAGLQAGDVLLSVGERSLDQDGNYNDPRYGKISIIHLLATHYFEGDAVPFKISRNGKEETRNVTLTSPDSSQSIIEPYTLDKAPRYYVLGGLVLQELSRQYLKEWGPEWAKKGPERLVYFDRFQTELFKDDPRQRIVILSQVLPSPCTVGYEEIHGLVVTKVNGIALKSLADIEEALKKPINGFHRIELQGHPGEIVLDAEETTAIVPALIKNYELPAIKRLE